jgi:hypothetical protein
MRDTAVRTIDIIVRSTLKRVRIQAKWLSAVTLTSNLAAFADIPGALQFRPADMLPLSLPAMRLIYNQLGQEAQFMGVISHWDASAPTNAGRRI